jgi:hypothetical protein
MAATHLFTCTCGVQKKTTNHWILAVITPASIRFVPWDSNLALQDDVIVLCGERCAAAQLSRALGEWKQAATPTVHPQAAQPEEELAFAAAY